MISKSFILLAINLAALASATVVLPKAEIVEKSFIPLDAFNETDVYALHQWNPKEKKADHDEGHHGPSKSHHPSKSPSWNHGGDHGGDGGEPVVTSPASFPHFPTTRPLASGRPTDAPTKPGHDGKGPKGPKDHDQDGDGDDGEHWGPSQGHHSHSGGPSKHHGSASWHWHSGSHSHELTKSRGPSSQYHQWNPKPTKPGPDDVLTPTGVVHPGDDGKPKPGKPCKGEVPGDGGKIKPGKPGKGEHPGDGGKPSDGGKDNGGKDNGGKDHGKDNWGPSASARARLNAAKPVDSLYALYGQAAADVCDLESQMPGAEITACPLENGSGWDCLNLASTLESCGGCQSIGEGQDCTAIKGAETVGCIHGKCVIGTCEDGFYLDSDKGKCVAN